MAIEQNFLESEACFESGDDCLLKQKLSPMSTSTRTSESDNGSFDCNICLDSACDPVVTLCGHLYCWPCIYRWLYVENTFPESNKQRQWHCPVCKANLSDSSFVPLYGHGRSYSESNSKKRNLGAVVPSRPPPSGLNASATSSATSAALPNQQHHSNIHQQLPPNFLQAQPHSVHHQQSFPHPDGGYAALYSSNLVGTTMASLFNPTIGMFGEMFFTRVFRSSDSSMFAYPHPSAQPILAGGSPRMRRQEMQLDKSLNRVSIFLLCCIILCLLLF